MKTYKEEVRECVYEWLIDFWKDGGEGEIINAYNKIDELYIFEKSITTSSKNIMDILKYNVKNKEDALASLIANGDEVKEFCPSATQYFIYMTDKKYIELDYVIRAQVIPEVLYEAISDTIEYYNELEDMK